MDFSNKILKNKYDRVMPRVGNQSGSTLKSSSFVTRHDIPSSTRFGAKTSVSCVSSAVFSDLPIVLNDYVPEASGDKVKKSFVVKPRRTIKSLDPALSPHRTVNKSKENVKSVSNTRFQESAPAVLTSNGHKWSDTHLKQCHSSRSHSRLKELKSEIRAFHETEKLMRLRSDLYKKCGVVLDDVGNVAVDKEVQVEDIGPKDTDKKVEIRRFHWLNLIHREELINSNPKSHVVCERHFEPSAIIISSARKSLKKGSVPSLLLPPKATLGLPQEQTLCMSQEETVRGPHEVINCAPLNIKLELVKDEEELYSAEESESNSPLPQTLCLPQQSIISLPQGPTLSYKPEPTVRLTLDKDGQIVEIKSEQKEVESRGAETHKPVSISREVAFANCSAQTDNISYRMSRECQTPNHLSSSTPRKRKLITELNECKKILKSFESQNKKVETFYGLCDKFLSEDFTNLVKEQVRCKMGNKGNRYTLEFKIFCNNLYYTSPKAYVFLQKTLCLPSPATMHKFTLPMLVSYDLLLSTLKAKVDKMPVKDKLCSVVIGTMPLKSNLYYDIKQDKIIGFQEIDGAQTSILANNALIVVVQGIIGKWMQPIAYALLSDSEDICMTNWIENIILKLIGLGLDVRTCIIDINLDFIKVARQEMVSADAPYLNLNNRKIYYIFDPPRLIRLARDSLMKYDFHFSGMTAKWEHLVKLFECDKDKDLKLASKITDKHLEPNGSQCLKVRSALQTFSRTVAAAMSAYIDSHAIDQSADATVTLISKLNNLFDVLNSSLRNGNNKYKQSYRSEEFQKSFLCEMIDFFQELDLFTPDGLKATFSEKQNLTDGFQITIKAIMLLHEELKKEGYDHLLTNRLNLDSLEAFSDKIRARNNIPATEPTSRMFVSQFRKLFFLNIAKLPTEATNSTDWIRVLKETAIFTGADSSDPDKSNVVRSSDIEWETSVNIATTDYQEVQLPKKDSLNYICSYLLQKSFKQDKDCPLLKTYISMDENSPNSTGFLILPADDFMKFIQAMEERFQSTLTTQLSGNIGKNIFHKINKIKFKPPCPCFPVTYLKKLFIRLRLYHTVKYNNKKMKWSNSEVKIFTVPTLN